MRLLDSIRNICSFFKNLLTKGKKYKSYQQTESYQEADNTVAAEKYAQPTVQHNDYEILYSLVLDELKKKYASQKIDGVLYFYDEHGICAYDDNGVLSLYLDINSDIMWHHDAIMFTIINDIKTESGPLDAIHIMPMIGALRSVGVVDGKYTPKHFPYDAYEELSKNFYGNLEKQVSTCGKLFLDESGHFNACLLDQFLLKNNISINYVRNPKGYEYLENLKAYRELLSRISDFKSFSLDMHCDTSEYSDNLFHFLSDLFDKEKYIFGGLELERQPVSENYTYSNGLKYVQSDSNSLYIFILFELRKKYNAINNNGTLTFTDNSGRICAKETGKNIKIFVEAKSNISSIIYELSITNDMKLDDTISDTVSITQVSNNEEGITPSGHMYLGSMGGSLCIELFGTIIVDNIFPSKDENPVINVLSVNANISHSETTDPVVETRDGAQTFMAYPAELVDDNQKKTRRK